MVFLEILQMSVKVNKKKSKNVSPYLGCMKYRFADFVELICGGCCL